MADTMMFIRYIPLALIWIVLSAFQFLLGWLLIAPFVKSDGNLPKPWSWLFQPTDSLAIGDVMYANNEAAWTLLYSPWQSRYLRAVMWGCRNPAYGFLALAGLTVNLDVFFRPYSVVGNENVDIGFDEAKQKPIYTLGTVYRTLWNGDGKKYFDWKHAGRWSANYGFMVRFGWNLEPALANGQRRSLYVDVRPRIRLL